MTGEAGELWGVPQAMKLCWGSMPDPRPNDPTQELAEELAGLRREVAELRRKLEFFQGAVDELPFPLFWKDDRSIYVGANRLQAQRSGLEQGSEVTGLSDDDLPWTEEEATAFRADDRLVMSLQQPLDSIVERQHVPGKGERVCETRKAPLRGADGGVIGVVGWYEDVTEREERRRAQALLDERLRRAHKQDSLGTLAGGIAHDFNNILASIMANLWLVQTTLPVDHPATESLGDIHRAGLRAKRLVEQLLSLRHQQPQELESVCFGELVTEASSLLRASLPPGVELAVDADSGPRVRGDASQLHQVIVNLCTNAMHAVSERPGRNARIDVTVAPLTLDRAAVTGIPGDLAPGDFVVLTVKDNGVGMDEATRLRIFEPFFTTREVGGGTGLGLPVVRGNVAAHKGAIEVQSAPGAGTTVRVFLPRAEGAPAVPPRSATPRPSSRPPSARRHVFYVDDDEGVLRAGRRLLRREGCDVVTFTDPREALAAFDADGDALDLLVVDFSMPHLTGLELAQHALERRPDLPVVLVSGYVTAEIRSAAERLGLARVVNKVDIAKELPSAVRSLLVTLLGG